MTRAIAGLLMMVTTAGGCPAEARGPHGSHGGGGFVVGQPHRGHPINAWLGSRRLHLR